MTSKACHLQMLKSRNKLSAQTSAAPVVCCATPPSPPPSEKYLPALLYHPLESPKLTFQFSYPSVRKL